MRSLFAAATSFLSAPFFSGPGVSRVGAISTLATSKAHAAGGTPVHGLVVGFHWAFGVGAVVTVAALLVMVALLRRRHVARIEEQAASGEPALVAV